MISRTNLLCSGNISVLAVVLVLCSVALGQYRNFTPVEGANLKARIDGAVVLFRELSN